MVMVRNRQPLGAVAQRVGEVKGEEGGEAEVSNMRRVQRRSPKARMAAHRTKRMQQIQQIARNAHQGPSRATSRSSAKMMIGQLGGPMALGAKGGETMSGIGKDGLGIAMFTGTSRLASKL